jgi:hypothetical protein
MKSLNKALDVLEAFVEHVSAHLEPARYDIKEKMFGLNVKCRMVEIIPDP